MLPRLHIVFVGLSLCAHTVFVNIQQYLHTTFVDVQHYARTLPLSGYDPSTHRLCPHTTTAPMSDAAEGRAFVMLLRYFGSMTRLIENLLQVGWHEYYAVNNQSTGYAGAVHSKVHVNSKSIEVYKEDCTSKVHRSIDLSPGGSNSLRT
ncbi:hypothetical protein FB451DRAFT_1170306 [Mycena latifolia]|nr:hypothetical protein FB451DRAFT_1170306 [Mycena latifolia]